MSLATNGFTWGYCTDNFPSTPSVTACATGFTAGANEADGAAVSCIAAITHDVHFIRIGLTGETSTGADSSAAGDLLVDPSGGTNWTSLIEDLTCGFTGATASGPHMHYEFPIYIASGSSIGWRAKSKHTADITTGCVLVQAFGEPSRPELWWCGSGVETLGASGARGTSITPGNSGAWGSWTTIGTSSRIYRAVQMGINGSDATANGAAYYFQIGHDSTALAGTSLMHMNVQTTELAYRHAPGMMTCSVPSGTDWQIRGMCSTTNEVFYGSVYGVY